jgi:hypothetical protein
MTKEEQKEMKDLLDKRIEAILKAASVYSEQPERASEYIRNSVHTVWEVGVEVGKSLVVQEMFNPGH